MLRLSWAGKRLPSWRVLVSVVIVSAMFAGFSLPSAAARSGGHPSGGHSPRPHAPPPRPAPKPQAPKNRRITTTRRPSTCSPSTCLYNPEKRPSRRPAAPKPAPKKNPVKLATTTRGGRQPSEKGRVTLRAKPRLSIKPPVLFKATVEKLHDQPISKEHFDQRGGKELQEELASQDDRPVALPRVPPPLLLAPSRVAIPRLVFRMVVRDRLVLRLRRGSRNSWYRSPDRVGGGSARGRGILPAIVGRRTRCGPTTDPERGGPRSIARPPRKVATTR